MTISCDVAVLGGGIIGRAIAFELASRCVGRLVVIDAGVLGGEASPAAAGFLPLASMRTPRGILFDLARASLDLYPEFLAAVGARSASDVGLATVGCLQLAAGPSQLQALLQRVERRKPQGFGVEFLGPEALRAHWPSIGEGFAAGALFPREKQVDARALLAALELACGRLGVEFRRGNAELRPGRNAARSVITVGDETVHAGQIVIAAGWWSAGIVTALGATLPVRPSRGEMVELLCSEPLPASVIEHDVVLLPRGNRRLWVGGLSEFDSSCSPTVAGRRELLEGAARIWPAAARAEIGAHWAGVRPCSAIRHPIIDRVPGWEDVYVATGHHRSGFLLAPLTAKVIAARILAEALPVEERAVRWT